MATWRDRFQALLEEVRSNELLKIDEVKIGEAASAADIQRATNAAGGALPPGMVEFYREMNGFCLTWSLRDPVAFGAEPGPTGSINLLPLIQDRGESVFGSWKDVVWFSEDDRFRRVVPFDVFAPEACAALSPIPGEGAVHFHYFGEDLYSTGRGFAEYLELLFVSRGSFYWPVSLCEEEQEGTTTVEDIRTNLPKIFPGVPLGSLSPKD
jgi:hypothetical protein